MFCTNCGTESPPNGKFCQQCGAPLAQAPAQPQSDTITISEIQQQKLEKKTRLQGIVLGVALVAAAIILLPIFFGFSPGDLGNLLHYRADDILKDAKWSLNHGAPEEITWVNRNGEKIQSLAVSGEVQIIVDPSKMSVGEVRTLASQNGGTIFAQLPTLGLYWAKVGDGQEAIFIENVRPSVSDVLPNIMLQTMQFPFALPLPTNYTYEAGGTPPFSVTSGNLMIDNFSSPMKLIVGYGKDAKGRIYLIYIKANSDGSPAVKKDVNGEKKFIEIKDPPMVPWVDEKGNVFVDEEGQVIMVPDLTKVAIASHGAISDYYRTYENQLTEKTLGSKSSMDMKDAPKSQRPEFLGGLLYLHPTRF